MIVVEEENEELKRQFSEVTQDEEMSDVGSASEEGNSQKGRSYAGGLRKVWLNRL